MDKFKLQYPALSQQYSAAKGFNFEIIAEVVETHFKDLFDLSLLTCQQM